MSQKNEFWGVTQGILWLIVMHLLAIIAIVLIGNILQSIYGGYSGLSALFFGIVGISLWQILYVIPACIWLKRKRKPLMMKGVIIGAIITFLLNGGCFLLLIIPQ